MITTSFSVPIEVLQRLPKYCTVLGKDNIMDMETDKTMDVLVVEWFCKTECSTRRAWFRFDNGEYCGEAW